MSTTDTSERGLESLILSALTGKPVRDTLTATRDESAPYAGAGYVQGVSHDFDRDYAVDLARLLDFLQSTQPDVVEHFDLTADTIRRRKFLARLRDEITRRGIIDVLCKGIRHGPAAVSLFYGIPTPGNFIDHPYRFLVVAEKFQTGYDEPLLHAMYVDKVLSGVRAVQTLSRLNRAHPQKHSTFVLDFFNDADTIRKAFELSYRTTILSEETDSNKLHDLRGDLDAYQVYAWEQVERLVARYVGGESRGRLDPILDACVTRYLQDLDEDGQVAFKGKAKAFVRTYNFPATFMEGVRREYAALAPEMPYVGGEENMFTEWLIYGVYYLAVYRALEAEGQTVEDVGRVIFDTFQAMADHPKWLLRLVGSLEYGPDYVDRLRVAVAETQKRRYPGDWVATFIEGDGEEFDYGLDVTECGICKFYHAQGADELVPYLCLSDYVVSDAFDRGLVRYKTLAEGAEVCDFRYKEGRETFVNPLRDGWPPRFLNGGA